MNLALTRSGLISIESEFTMKRNKLWRAICGTRLCGLWALILTVSAAFGESPKISPDLASLPSNAPVNVVVQYYSAPTNSNVNAAKSVGAANGKALGLVNSYKWSMTQGSVQSLIA